MSEIERVELNDDEIQEFYKNSLQAAYNELSCFDSAVEVENQSSISDMAKGIFRAYKAIGEEQKKSYLEWKKINPGKEISFMSTVEDLTIICSAVYARIVGIDLNDFSVLSYGGTLLSGFSMIVQTISEISHAENNISNLYGNDDSHLQCFIDSKAAKLANDIFIKNEAR